MARVTLVLAVAGVTAGILHAAVPAGASGSIGGVYCGTAISGGRPVEVRTTLTRRADGLLAGYYAFADRGETTQGELQENIAQPGSTRTLIWRDKYGVGLANFVFSEGGDEFEGHWGVGLGVPQIPWNGKRCDTPSV